ncbi:MAG: multidrug resistance efflux pump [Verrucomicrobiaceae bacterium]|nr:multidrug resistance efflux pump [Verrucomicrobiaceae bacterium]
MPPPAETPESAANAVPSHDNAPPPGPPPGSPAKSRKPLLIVIGIAVLAAVLIWGVPAVRTSLSTASTDDAYVNGHLTFVAPRVGGQVAKVLVDDNNRVRKGDLIVELDKEPYRVQLAIKQAMVDSAQADFAAAQMSIRGQVAQSRSLRFKLSHAIEDVNGQAALLRSRVAGLQQSKASLALAQAEFERSKGLLASHAVSKDDFDQRENALKAAQAQNSQALESVYQIRVSLGLPPKTPEGTDLDAMPADLEQNVSSVRQVQAELLQAAAQLGILPTSYDLSPKAMVDEFIKRDPDGNIDRIYAKVAKEAPAQKQAAAKLESAQKDFAQAELNLKYCDVRAEIDGVITRRNVNPGNNVQMGQNLMVIRSLSEIWVDANFKETQLADLRIGQRVDLKVDMYGKTKEFQGRISGFTMGTGSTLALLPAQNATGNFIKVVQRLPVRIDLVDYHADKDPLFVGLSVEPLVHIKEAATGPNAGGYLQPLPAAVESQP